MIQYELWTEGTIWHESGLRSARREMRAFARRGVESAVVAFVRLGRLRLRLVLCGDRGVVYGGDE